MRRLPSERGLPSSRDDVFPPRADVRVDETFEEESANCWRAMLLSCMEWFVCIAVLDCGIAVRDGPWGRRAIEHHC